MDAFVAKHAAVIQGVLSCFDRVLFRGYVPLMSGYAMAEFLTRKQVQRRTLKSFLLTQAERVGCRVGRRYPQRRRAFDTAVARARAVHGSVYLRGCARRSAVLRSDRPRSCPACVRGLSAVWAGYPGAES